MGLEGVQAFITTLGFPIACVVAMGFFIWKIWNKSQQQNEQRENKLYEVIIQAQLQNDQLSHTNSAFVKVLENYKNDLETIKTDVALIKNATQK